MTLTDKQKEFINNASRWGDDYLEQLQDIEYQTKWLELTLNEFLEDGNVETFIRCLTDVVKVRVKNSGHG